MGKLKIEAEQIRNKGKTPISKENILHAEFDFKDSLNSVRAFAKKDALTAEFLLQRLVLKLLQFYFDKNCIWTPSPKKLLENLRLLNPTLSDKFDNFYKNETLYYKIKIVDSILTTIFQNSISTII